MAHDESRIRTDSAGGDAPVPVASMVESIVGCKWSVRLLQLCADGHTRPSTFLRACPGLSAKVMNERWRKMLRFGIVRRTVCGAKPPLEVEYRLTPFGHRFLGILDEVRRLQEAMDDGAIGAAVDVEKRADRQARAGRPPRRVAT
jgi:DNA-binding HxlR family transcriptional regulator